MVKKVLIIGGPFSFKFCESKLKHVPISFPDPQLAKHCQLKEGMDTLYSPNPSETQAVKTAEGKLQEAVARYAEDNLLVVRVRKP